MGRFRDVENDAELRRFLLVEADNIASIAASEYDMVNRIAAGQLARRDRRPVLMLLAAALAMMLIGGGAVLGMRLVPAPPLPPKPPVAIATDSPAPSATPARNPTPRALRFQLDPLPAGDYVVDRIFPFHVSMTLPEGWSYGTVTPNTMGVTHRSDAGVGIWLVNSVYEDPCRWDRGTVGPLGDGVEPLVEALAGMPSFHVTEPRDVVLLGFPGKQLDLYAPANLRDCYDSAAINPWVTDDAFLGESGVMHINVLDANGSRLVVATWEHPNTAEEIRHEAQAILDSMELAPR
jgi:hypothetical protein